MHTGKGMSMYEEIISSREELQSHLEELGRYL